MANIIQQARQNSKKPAPKWFRKFKNIFTDTENSLILILLAMGYGAESLVILLIKVGTSWILRTLETILTNGEEYAPAGTTNELEGLKETSNN
ncbi:MAG: hypothetical protein QM791_04030 [Ferruginibacter sp.]